MPATRRSMAADAATPLKPISDNVIVHPTPSQLNTPGKKVVALKAELEKKDAENEALRKNIAELTNALAGLTVVKEKIENDGTAAAAAAVAAAAAEVVPAAAAADGTTAPTKRNKPDKNAPVPAKTAYKFYCDAHPKPKNQAAAVEINMQKLWKETAPEIRSSYEAMAKADKARYARELASYNEEKAALQMYYEKKRQDVAMEFLDAHLNAQKVLEKVDAENAKNKKGGKAKKAAKDPEAPKRPLSSYMYFVSEVRESVTKKNPSASPTEVMKTLGEMWTALEKGREGAKGTKRYDDLAAADRVRYETEKKAYDAVLAERKLEEEREKIERLNKDKEEALKLMRSREHDAATAVAASVAIAAATAGAVKTVAVDDNMSIVSDLTNANANAAANNKATKQPKKKKDPNAPKKASSAYIYFSNENRNIVKATMPEGTNQKDLLTEIGRQWKELSEEKKDKYNKMAEADKVRYAKEMEVYNANGGGSASAAAAEKK